MSFQLHDIEKKKAPFTVPDGYFDELKSNILNQVGTPAKETVMVSMWSGYQWLAASIAALLLIFFVGQWLQSDFISNNQLADATFILDEVSDDDLMEYVALMNISHEEILAGMSKEELEGLLDVDPMEVLDFNNEEVNELLYELENETEILL